MAEILRISAPNPPLSDNKLKALCTLFIDELSIIAFVEDHLARFRFSLLEQLATVKTFAIFADEDHVVADIFACFYASTRPHQRAKYKEHLGYILSTLLEEVPEIEQPLLDALLAPLTRSENPATESGDAALKTLSSYSASAAALAEYVVIQSKNLVQVPICNFFNSALHQLSKGRIRTSKSTPTRRKTKKLADADNEQEIDSELMEDIEKLVVSVNRIAPDMLIYVIPSLEDRLGSEEAMVRRNIAHLLGKLFMSSSATIDAYPSLFTEYLRRARDRDEAVRAEVCATIGPLLVSNPRHRDLLDKRLQDRVLDPDEKVRRIIAVSIGRTGAFASPDLIEAVSSRMRDKKATVRHETFRQLSALYRSELKHVPSEREGEDKEEPITKQIEASTEMVDTADTPGEGEGGTERDVLNPSVLERVDIPIWMSRLPNVFMSTHQALQFTGDPSLLEDIEKTVFEQLYSWDSYAEVDDDLRVRRFAALVGNLESNCLVYFSRLISRRTRIAAILRKVCSIRLSGKSAEVEAARESLTPPKRSDEELSTPVVGKKKTFSKRGRTTPVGSPEQKSSTKTLQNRFNRDLRAASDALALLLGRRKFRNEEIAEMCWKMCSFADRRFYEQLKIAISLTSSTDSALAAGPEAVSRLSSKSLLGEFVGTVVLPAARAHIFSVQHLKAAYGIVSRYCTDMKEKNAQELKSRDVAFGELSGNSFVKDNDILYGVLRYIELSSLHCPEVYANLTSLPSELVRKADHKSLGGTQILLCGLKVLSRVDCSRIGEKERDLLVDQLHLIITGPVRQDAQISSVLAKWAAQALIRLCSELHSSDEVWNRTRSLLTEQLKSSEGNAMELVGPVTALGQLAKHAAPVFKSCYLETFDYAKLLLSGEYNSKICQSMETKGQGEGPIEQSLFQCFWQSSFPPSCGGCHLTSTEFISDIYISSLAELSRRAIKLMVYAIHAVDADDDDVDEAIGVLVQASMSKHGLLEKHGDIFNLHSILKTDNTSKGKASGDVTYDPGDSDGGEDENKDDEVDEADQVATRACNIIRLASSCGIIYMARSSRHFRRVKPDDILCAMMCSQDPEPEVRISFARNLHRYVLRKRLPFRWIASLALMAPDPDRANQTEVRLLLTKALREKRNRISKSRAQSSSIRKLLPEASVPVLVWVLANHPDAESDAKAGYPDAELCMEFLLDRLLESNEFAAVIHEYLDALMVAWDRSETGDEPGPKTQRIRILARVCTVLLKKKQAGKKWNLLEHPGRVELPGDLFRKESANAENSAAAPSSLLDVARMYDADARSEDPKTDPPVLQKEDMSNLSATPRSTVRTPVIVRGLGESPKQSVSEKETPAVTPKSSASKAHALRKVTPMMTPKPSIARTSDAELLSSPPKSSSSRSSAQRKRRRSERNEESNGNSRSDSSASKRKKQLQSSNSAEDAPMLEIDEEKRTAE